MIYLQDCVGSKIHILPGTYANDLLLASHCGEHIQLAWVSSKKGILSDYTCINDYKAPIAVANNDSDGFLWMHTNSNVQQFC